MKAQKILLPIVAILGALVFFSIFIVKEVNQAIVLQFGDPKKIIIEPGLNFKLPFIQNVVFLDSRILNLGETFCMSYLLISYCIFNDLSHFIYISKCEPFQIFFIDFFDIFQIILTKDNFFNFRAFCSKNFLFISSNWQYFPSESDFTCHG